ncbi:MAG: NAD(P)H-dependent oxidoreductase [Gimesia sp.]|jgi:FMN-dependent NADH-azoreductase|nr:NAD(P)H-dependent oxidoreductase [Gimesia sp.]
MGKNVLLVSGSAQGRDASSHKLAQQVVEKFEVSELKIRDLSNGLASINHDWVSANFADQTERSEAQNDTLRQSDELIAELTWADIVVIAAPIYNFGVPSALKAWVDYVCRAGLTFNYTETGPVGLLSGKRAILAITSGGVPVDSPVDFATPHLRQVLNFIGISEIQTVRADQQVTTADFMDRANSDLLAIA